MILPIIKHKIAGGLYEQNVTKCQPIIMLETKVIYIYKSLEIPKFNYFVIFFK